MYSLIFVLVCMNEFVMVLFLELLQGRVHMVLFIKLGIIEPLKWLLSKSYHYLKG